MIKVYDNGVPLAAIVRIEIREPRSACAEAVARERATWAERMFKLAALFAKK